MGKTISPKYLVIIILCTAFIFGGALVGEKAARQVFNLGQAFPTGAYVGQINIENLELSDARLKLQQEMLKWQEQKKIKVKYNSKENSLPMDLFLFDIEGTLTLAQKNKNVPFVVVVNNENLKNIINSMTMETDDVDIKSLEQELLTSAQQLEPNETVIDLINYINNNGTEEVIVSLTSVFPKELEVDMDDWIQQMSSFTLSSNEEVSLLNIVGTDNLTDQSKQALNQISSLLYKTIVHTNFQVRERYISATVPNDVELGYEAKVDPGKMDFVVLNPNSTEYKIELSINGTTLTSTVKGRSLAEEYEIEIEKSEYEPKTIIQYAPIVNGAKKQVIENGKSGYLVKVFKKDKHNSNPRKLISEDIYLPIHRRELHELPSNQVEEQVNNNSNLDMYPEEINDSQQQLTNDIDPSFLDEESEMPNENDENNIPD